MLAEYQYILGPAADGPDLYDYNTIAYLPERLELLDSGGFYLSETPEVWSLGWDATYFKALTWARFRRTEDQSEFLSLNTHLEHIGELARVESVRLILRRLPELRAYGFADTFLGAGGEDSAASFTFHGFEGALLGSEPPHGRAHRLDPHTGWRGERSNERVPHRTRR